MKRRTILDVITRYRRAKARRAPDENDLSLELGATLAKSGTVAELGRDNRTVTMWQPVNPEGGPPGFAHARFKNAATVPAPRYRPELSHAG